MYITRKNVVEINMLLDIMVIDKNTRKIIGRPWLAAAIYIPTGYVLSTRLSFASPSAKLDKIRQLHGQTHKVRDESLEQDTSTAYSNLGPKPDSTKHDL